MRTMYRQIKYDITKQPSIDAAIQAATAHKERTIDVVNNRSERAFALAWNEDLGAVVRQGPVDLIKASRGGCGIEPVGVGNGGAEWVDGSGLRATGCTTSADFADLGIPEVLSYAWNSVVCKSPIQTLTANRWRCHGVRNEGAGVYCMSGEVYDGTDHKGLIFDEDESVTGAAQATRYTDMYLNAYHLGLDRIYNFFGGYAPGAVYVTIPGWASYLDTPLTLCVSGDGAIFEAFL